MVPSYANILYPSVWNYPYLTVLIFPKCLSPEFYPFFLLYINVVLLFCEV